MAGEVFWEYQGCCGGGEGLMGFSRLVQTGLCIIFFLLFVNGVCHDGKAGVFQGFGSEILVVGRGGSFFYFRRGAVVFWGFMRCDLSFFFFFPSLPPPAHGAFLSSSIGFGYRARSLLRVFWIA